MPDKINSATLGLIIVVTVVLFIGVQIGGRGEVF